jgi:hypothetical protein
VATNSDRRLGRLYGALTPQERAVLVLRAWKEGREPARQLLTSSTLEEAYQYNRLLDLLRAASEELTQYLNYLHLLVGQEELRSSWFQTALLWGLAEREPERAEELSERLRSQLAVNIALRWRELRALEAVLDEIAGELEGEDPLHPEARARLGETRQRLLALHETVAGYREACELRAPEPAEVAAVRELTRKGDRR